MIFKDLNKRFDYSLKGKTYKPSRVQRRLIYGRDVTDSSWSLRGARYVGYKKALKKEHYFNQRLRCAYCRVELRADAYWEDLDHVVAQSDKGRWVFYPKNLIVTCGPCNKLKNADTTLTNPNARYFPLHSGGFRIFNPHFDNWSDHFVIEKGLFLKGIPNTKGPETYKYCHLYRHDIIIDYAKQQLFWKIFTMKRLTHRLRNSTVGSNEAIHIQVAIDHLLERKRNSL